MEELLQQIITKLDYLENGQKELKIDISGLKEDVSGLKVDVSGLKEDVSGLKEDVSGLKEDVSGLKEDVSGLKEDVSNLKISVSGLQTELNEFKLETRQGIETINGKLDIIQAQVAYNTEQGIKINEVIDEHDTDIKLIKKVITNQ